jgi:transcriptional regulator with XRE-family HTH domain
MATPGTTTAPASAAPAGAPTLASASASVRSVKGKRRAELAAFLRSRRELITPEDVGIAPGGRRRTPGLRREELAQLAGVGVTWYTWLEQGRPIHASPQVLDAVAGVLRLSRAEHAHLYRLADMPEVQPAGSNCGSCLPPDMQAILDGFVDRPASVFDGKYELLMWNADYAALFPTVTGPDAERNILAACLTGEWESPVADPEMLAHMVALARAAYSRHVGEPEWTEFVRRLSAASPQFAELWATNRVAEPMPLVKRFNCFGMGTFHARTTSFTIPGSPDTRMVVYVPERPDDLDLLNRLRQRPRG